MTESVNTMFQAGQLQHKLQELSNDRQYLAHCNVKLNQGGPGESRLHNKFTSLVTKCSMYALV